MAAAVVSFVLRKFDDAVLKRAFEEYQVSDQVEKMRLELGLIEGLLRDADSKRKRNPSVKNWLKEVREVAHKIEDAMDIFLVEIEENRPESSGIMRKIKRVGKNPLKLSWLSTDIQKILETLKTLYDRKSSLGITVLTDTGTGSEDNSWVPFRPSQLADIDDSEVVGLDSDKRRIIEHLLDRSISRRTVLSIVGIGGLGKTTLAQKVFKSAELEGKFDYQVWLSISQKYDLEKILREILFSIQPEIQTKEPPITDKHLSMELKRFLDEKRYLIILDDVWTKQLWDQLKIKLPDKKNGSRVLITSRSFDVAKAADSEIQPYELPYLTEKESLDLLRRKAFPHKQLDDYPPNLKEVAVQLAKKCGRLPLALIVLGGILSRKEDSYSAWQNVEQTMDWYDEDGEKCSQVLAMSYEDLPYDLKPCFLYFASYPEDHKVSAKHVTRMWIAEGFISKGRGITLEDKADKYLEELAQRCLVQVIEKSWNGNCKYCVMHDLLRDLAIHEANEENFFTVFSKAEDCSQLDANRVRRAAIQITEYDIHSKNVRSLLFFGQCILNYHRFRLLRVLTIEGVDMSKKKIDYGKWLKSLIHLRYLGFRYCNILPEGFEHVSFSSFNNLETLDFKGTKVHDGPHHSLWKVSTLRHVISPRTSPFVCSESKWDHLKNLQTLKWVRFQNFPELGCHLNLRRIGLDLSTDFWKQCESVEQAQHKLKIQLKKMEFLVSLAIRSDDFVPFPIGSRSELPCYEKIQRLYLYGEWPRGIVLNVEMFPTNLTKFTLRSSKLEHDPMPVLERLQSLRILLLGIRSYRGKEMICSTGGFPSLQTLNLENITRLCHWDIKEGAMPKLSQLKIRGCGQLHAFPDLQNVPTLQELILQHPSDELCERMRSEDHYKIKHIPSVRTEYP